MPRDRCDLVRRTSDLRKDGCRRLTNPVQHFPIQPYLSAMPLDGGAKRIRHPRRAVARGQDGLTVQPLAAGKRVEVSLQRRMHRHVQFLTSLTLYDVDGAAV